MYEIVVLIMPILFIQDEKETTAMIGISKKSVHKRHLVGKVSRF